MKTVILVLLQIFVVVLIVAGMPMLLDGWTVGTYQRVLTDPEISDRPVGYNPPDLLALQRQLLDGRYDALDAHFAAMQREYLSGTRPELEYILSYSAFATTSPEIGAALDRWIAARPESATSFAARAAYRMRLGWRMGDYAEARLTPSQDAKWLPDAGLYADARRDLEKAVSVDPLNVQAHASLMTVTDRLKDEARAATALRAGLAADPLSLTLHGTQVRLLLDGPDGRQAAEAYVAALRPDFARNPVLNRLDVLILIHRARGLAEDDDSEKAMDLLFEAGRIAESANLLGYRARLLGEAGHRAWAAADLGRALAFLPHNISILADRAELYTRMGRTEEAEQDFALALELDPLDTRTLWKRYRTFYHAKQFREGEADLTMAMKLRPDDPRLRFQRGLIRLNEIGDAAGAAEDLEVAATGFPNSPNLLKFYARALTEVDDCRAVAVVEQYRKACEITESDDCSRSTIRAETRRVEKMNERLVCAPAS